MTTKEAAASDLSEHYFVEYLEGLFWITVWGLGLILGGLFLLKKVQLSVELIIAYLLLSSTAFLILFVLCFRKLLHFAGNSKESTGITETGRSETRELNPLTARAALEAPPSVTENTTRSFEPLSQEKVIRR